MKIAIIAPSPVPFTIGGAEKLWWGMLRYINQQTTHQCELVKIPAPERNFEELISSYQHFSTLDLNHFDCVISTKYPAWMVDHPNHYCYLQHRLRGLYDTYPYPVQSLSELPDHNQPGLRQLLELLQGPSPQDLQQLWQLIQQLQRQIKQHQFSEDILAFPGPLSRAVIHFLDNYALNPYKIKRFFAISQNITRRKGYFPESQSISIIHHPSDLPLFDNNDNVLPAQNSQYIDSQITPVIFTISRLDRPKRLDLLIQAFKKLKTPAIFKIAGEGPEQDKLQQLAEADHRIQFLGRITDQQTVNEYRNALFVPYIPYDEDYGLVTIEAMRCGKAVLTTTDAGGVNEFVIHRHNGLSVAPKVDELARAMHELLSKPHQTQKMGAHAYASVGHISWENTINTLLTPRQHIVVLLTFSVWPPQGGGQSRVYHLYRQLAHYHDITLLALIDADHKHPPDSYHSRRLAPNLREICVTKSWRHKKYQDSLHRKLQVPIGDIANIEGHHLTPHYARVIQQLVPQTDLFILCHPYLYYALKPHWQGSLWLEAQDVEIELKTAILGESKTAKKWLKKIRGIEYSACLHSQCIMTCSERDAKKLQTIYLPHLGSRQFRQKFLIAANGVNLPQAVADKAKQHITEPSEKTVLQQSDNTLICLFMGSYHGPNIEAVEQIKKIAGQTPNISYWIMGSVCNHHICKQLPANCHVLGLVSETEKNEYWQYVDVALNPMLSGSGTNLKMLEYAANQIAILTTPFGLRGLEFPPQQAVMVHEITEFKNCLEQLQQQKTKKELKQKLRPMTQQAYQITKQKYQWRVIAEKIQQRLNSEFQMLPISSHSHRH